VRGIPTMILFHSGQEVGRVVGADIAGLRELADRLLRP